MRVVIDSNVLIAIIGKRNKLKPIWDAFIQGSYLLIVLEEIMQEHSVKGAAELVMEIFIESPDVIFQHVHYNWYAITVDPGDNKFFDIAVAANAGFLVTNDRHFDEAKLLPFTKVKIIFAEDFCTIFLALC